MSTPVKILIVNGDDFGLSESINRGILTAFRNGILRSTSLMPNGEAFDDALRIARENPGLDVGIHLSLLDMKSVAPTGDLRRMVTADGSLPEHYSIFVRQLMRKQFTVDDVRTEVLAQIQRVLEAGIEPTHIDSHQHLHMIAGIFDVVFDAAQRFGIPAIRVPLEQGGSEPRGLIARLIHTSVLSRVSARRLLQVRQAGLHSADWFWGLGTSGKMDEANLINTLQMLRPGVNEIMCHPGISDRATSTRYRWGYDWDDELAALTSGKVREFLQSNDIRLASFADAWDSE